MAYEGYKGQCIGRLMYFLYKYSHEFDRMMFDGKGNVLQHSLDPDSTIVATYTWDNDGDSDVPTFEFKRLPKAKYDWEVGSERWVERMKAQQEYHKPQLLEDDKRYFEYRNKQQFVPWSKKENELTAKLEHWNRKACLEAQIFNIPCSSVQTRKRYTPTGRHVDQ